MKQKYPNIPKAYIILFLVTTSHYFLAGCIGIDAPTDTFTRRYKPISGIQESEAILILHNSEDCTEASAPDEKLFKCVLRAIQKSKLEVEVFSPEVFRNKFLHDFINCESTIEAIETILENSGSLYRIKSLNIHYIVVVNFSSYSDWKASPGFYTFLGEKDHDITISGLVFDFKNGYQSGEITAFSNAKDSLGLFFLIPIVYTEDSESPAYERFGEEVVKYILGQTNDKK